MNQGWILQIGLQARLRTPWGMPYVDQRFKVLRTWSVHRITKDHIHAQWELELDGPNPKLGKWRKRNQIFSWEPQKRQRLDERWYIQGADTIEFYGGMWILKGPNPRLELHHKGELVWIPFISNPEDLMLLDQTLESLAEQSLGNIFQEMASGEPKTNPSPSAANLELILEDVQKLSTQFIISSATVSLHEIIDDVMRTHWNGAYPRTMLVPHAALNVMGECAYQDFSFSQMIQAVAATWEASLHIKGIFPAQINLKEQELLLFRDGEGESWKIPDLSEAQKVSPGQALQLRAQLGGDFFYLTFQNFRRSNQVLQGLVIFTKDFIEPLMITDRLKKLGSWVRYESH